MCCKRARIIKKWINTLLRRSLAKQFVGLSAGFRRSRGVWVTNGPINIRLMRSAGKPGASRTGSRSYIYFYTHSHSLYVIRRRETTLSAGERCQITTQTPICCLQRDQRAPCLLSHINQTRNNKLSTHLMHFRGAAQRCSLGEQLKRFIRDYVTKFHSFCLSSKFIIFLMQSVLFF